MNIFTAPDLEGDVKKMTDCNHMMREFLLNQYLIYKYRTLVAFFIAGITVPLAMKYFDIKNGSYFRTYLFLFAVFYITQWAITEILKKMLDTDALNKLLASCQGWQNDSTIKAACKSVIDPDKASVYLQVAKEVKEIKDVNKVKEVKEGFTNSLSPVSKTRELNLSEDLPKRKTDREELINDDGTPSAANEVGAEAFSNPRLTGGTVSTVDFATAFNSPASQRITKRTTMSPVSDSM